jgi:hypothetical protein
MSDLDLKLRMDETLFWEFIDFLNWEKISKNPENFDKNLVFIKLIRKYGKMGCDEAFHYHRKKYRSLIEIVNTYKYLNNITDSFSGDDGLWDVTAHVVGLGKEEYWKSVKNPEYLLSRWQNGDYVECFSYWIPKKHTKIDAPNSSKFINGEL